MGSLPADGGETEGGEGSPAGLAAALPQPPGSQRRAAGPVRHGGRLSGYAGPCRWRLDSASGRRHAPLAQLVRAADF